jgi:hypothetical protein
MVKARWQFLLVDRMVVAAFTESLAGVEFGDAAQIVRDFSETGREQPPTIGMIYRAAMELSERREEQARRTRRSIEERPSAAEQERMRQNFSNLFNKLARSVGAGSVDAGSREAARTIQSVATTSAAARDIDPETKRAQEIILMKRREKLR